MGDAWGVEAGISAVAGLTSAPVSSSKAAAGRVTATGSGALSRGSGAFSCPCTTAACAFSFDT